MRLPLEVHDLIQVKTSASSSSFYAESRVEEVAADELLISWPTYADERIPIREHQLLTVSFSHYQRVFEFDATVLNAIDDPVALLAVRPSGSLRTVQRRDDVRIRARAPVELAARVVGLARFKDARTRFHHIKSETVTISAGGFAIQSGSRIEVGTLFEVNLTLPGEKGSLGMSARVVRCSTMGDQEAQPPLFEVGFAFTRIPQAARTRIVRFVFGVQREERLEE